MTTLKAESNYANDKAKSTYRTAVDLSRKLDKIHKSKRCYKEIFIPEALFLRRKLQEYCEKLIFLYNPLEYGRKAEELLWRKVFYDVIQIVKQNKKHMNPSGQLEAAYRTHLDSALGYYTHLLFELQNRFEINIESQVDFSIIENPKCFKPSYSINKGEIDLKVISWARLAAHRCLVYLGDIARYQVEFEGELAAMSSHRYYLQAFGAFPESGHPHNQIGTLLDGYRYNLDSIYHYIRCLGTIIPLTSAAEGNLERAFDKNFKRYKDLECANDSDKNGDLSANIQHCKDVRRFIINFIHVIQLFLSKSKGIPNSKSESMKELNLTCQNVLTDFKSCMYHNVNFKQSTRDSQLDRLDDDILFKMSVICLASVYLLPKYNRNEFLPAAVAFSLALFSSLLQQVIVRLQDNLQDLEEPVLFALSGSTTPAESILNLEMFDGIENSEKQLPTNRHRRCRRKRRRVTDASNSESADTMSAASDSSDLSEGLVTADLVVSSSDSDMEQKFLQHSPGDSDNSDVEGDNLMISQDRSWLNSGLSGNFGSSMNAVGSDLSSVKEESSMTQLPHFMRQMSENQNSNLFPGIVDGKKFIKPPPGFEKTTESQHVDDISNKIATFQFDTDTDTSVVPTDTDNSDDENQEKSLIEKRKTRVERIIKVAENEGLLKSVYLFSIWLKNNKEILVHTCTDSSQMLWQRMCTFLNFLPTQQELKTYALSVNEKLQHEANRILNGFQTTPFTENITMRCFVPFRKMETHLKMDNPLYAKREELILRLCALHSFGQHATKLQPKTPICIKDDNYFCANNQNESHKAADEARRERLMKDMAQLRLKAIGESNNSVDKTIKVKNKPVYAVIDGMTILEKQLEVEKILQEPAVMVIIPLVALDFLDELKTTDRSAQAAIRWLEDTIAMKKKFRKLRIQRSDERTDVGAQKNLKKRDRQSWRLTQLIDCARYLTNQSGNNVRLIVSEKPNLESLRPIAKTMLECIDNEYLSMLTMTEFLEWLESNHV